MNTTFYFNIDDNRNTPSNISSVLEMVEVPTYKNNTNGKKYFFEINPSNKSKAIQSFIENDYKDFTIINDDGTPENYVNGVIEKIIPDVTFFINSKYILSEDKKYLEIFLNNNKIEHTEIKEFNRSVTEGNKTTIVNTDFYFSITRNLKDALINLLIANGISNFIVHLGTKPNFPIGTEIIEYESGFIKKQPKKESNSLRFVGAGIGFAILLSIFSKEK